jgi:hypothetical protein
MRRENSATNISVISETHKSLIHSIEKQLKMLVGILPHLTTNKCFRKSISMTKVEVDQFEEVLTVLSTINESIQLVVRR